MIGKRQLIAFIMLVALTMVGVLNLSTVRVSAVESPAIYISPAYVRTEDPWSAVGTNYTFSVYTDYDGSDVWGYEFKLTYNPLVLEGVEVVNGDLITEDDGIIMWLPGTFNNTAGTLSMTGNSFYWDFIPPPPLVSGPGTLANVTFTVVGYGISNIAFVESETRLIGIKEEGGEWKEYNIIDKYWPHTGHIEGSIFYNTILSDIRGPESPPDSGLFPPDGVVDIWDFGFIGLAYGKTSADPDWDDYKIADTRGPESPPGSGLFPPDGVVDIWDFGYCGLQYGESF